MESWDIYRSGLIESGSLISGLTAWILPVIGFVKVEKLNNRTRLFLTIISLASCTLALLLAMISQNHMAETENWSGVMDTSGPFLRVSIVLVSVTFVVNIVNLIVYKYKRNKSD
ncbi:MAG: SAC family polyphosphoinositide phosphatase [Clostridiales bacterium]|nr:SAC family polyphosphoinositide phosphatase [Clostridiales bacterium]